MWKRKDISQDISQEKTAEQLSLSEKPSRLEKLEQRISQLERQKKLFKPGRMREREKNGREG